MNKLLISLNLLIRPNGLKKAAYLKKKNIFYEMGENCYFHPYNIPSEPKLLKLHNNVSIASGVTFVTHDIIAYMLNNTEKYKNNPQDYHVGAIEVGNNVFIGANTIILPDVKIGNNVVIGAGSVVTKDIPDGSVAGGTPARVISEFSRVCEKNEAFSKRVKELRKECSANIIDKIVEDCWKHYDDKRTVDQK